MLQYCNEKRIRLSGVHVVGGVACNGALQEMMRIEASKHRLELYSCPLELCLDNGAMIAWTGWELKNAEQDVCVRDIEIEGHRRVPLGNYLVDHLFMSDRQK